MILRRAYYTLKPFIPARWRLALRRANARRLRHRCSGLWPVCEANGRVPEGWPGWPGGKEFAFVLSHDVEGPRGLERCRALAEIEMRLGFRSSFNLIPEGDYTVPESLRSWLVENGFEIGVHDFRHDGLLFRSRKTFEANAGRISDHLSRWGAVGFRAGFMLHELDWLHALKIEYDSSTFEVDPFEPQPDGANTIFPFWVPKPDPDADAWRREPERLVRGAPAPCAEAGRSGYMELPYTLIQDFNLFVVLGEPGIEPWRQKLEWLASRGGMALLDTHPDYQCLTGRPGAFELPVQRYVDFLELVRREYAGAYWHALPREVARFCRGFRPRHTRPPREVCMLSYSFYEGDNRVKRYAETLVRRGDRVRVFCLGSTKGARRESMGGVEVVRLQSRRADERGQLDYALRLARFFWRALWALRAQHLRSGCDLLHIHNIPDFMVFAGLYGKLKGARILLDIHDVVPELYQDKFGYTKDALAVRWMRRVEAWSGRFADHVIVANHLWKSKVAARSVPAGKLTALVNNVDLDLFHRHPRTRHDARFVLFYPGSLNWHQGLDIAIEAMALLQSSLPSAELHIVAGGGPAAEALRALASRLALQERVRFFDGYPISEIPALMANADAGVVPKRADGFGNEAYSTKIMEFMSQGLPVVASRTRIDSHYFTDNEVCFFESGNAADLAAKILRVATDKGYRDRLSQNALAYAHAHSWATMKHVYLDVVDRLTLTGVPRHDPAPIVSCPAASRESPGHSKRWVAP